MSKTVSHDKITKRVAIITQMEPNFQLAQSFDIDALIVFMQEFYEVEHLRFDIDIARAALSKLLSDDSLGRVWLIHNDGEAIGYIVLAFGYSLEFGGRDAFVDELYIRASHRGQGIGKKTLKFLSDVCPSLGIKALHLEVDRVNTIAQGLYRKAGFVDHDRYLMTKWISSA